MREVIDAAVGFPTMTFTAALIVVAGFWLLVLLGAAEHDSFDPDVNVDSLGLEGISVAASASLVIILAWIFSVAGSVLLLHSEVAGLLRATLAMAVFVASLTFAYAVARVLVGPLGQLRGRIRALRQDGTRSQARRARTPNGRHKP